MLRHVFGMILCMRADTAAHCSQLLGTSGEFSLFVLGISTIYEAARMRLLSLWIFQSKTHECLVSLVCIVSLTFQLFFFTFYSSFIFKWFLSPQSRTREFIKSHKNHPWFLIKFSKINSTVKI